MRSYLVDTTIETTPAALALFSGVIDYAGLFPPAQLGMAETVRNYLRYRGGEHAWMLGRVVIPAHRLCEFGEAVRLFKPAGPAVQVSALCAHAGELGEVVSFSHVFGDAAVVDCVETRASSAEQVVELAQHFRTEHRRVYVELAIDDLLDSNLAAVKQEGVRAKVRTGSVKPEGCVGSAPLARFIAACARKRVAFKATAGLHHVRPGVRALTYASDSPCGHMHGFLNVLAASALAWHGKIASEEDIISVLDGDDLEFKSDSLCWRGRCLNTQELQAARHDSMVAFGSCSFEEPQQELQAEGLI